MLTECQRGPNVLGMKSFLLFICGPDIKSKAITVTGHGGLHGCEMLRNVKDPTEH